MKRFKTETLLLLLILSLGAFFRFYKLDWAQGLFTHPDEYHIAASVNQLSFPHQMHPHFFSYGTTTIYLIYFTKLALESLNSQFLTMNFLNPILLGRFYSALFATLAILMVYKISCSFLEKKWALLSASFVALTPGLIQQAHFTTPESNLTFFLLLTLYSAIRLKQTGKLTYLFLSAVSAGLSLGIKIVAVLIIPVIFLSILTYTLSLKRILLLRLVRCYTLLVTATGVILLIFFIAAPFVFLDRTGFRSNLNYEGPVATGSLPVFYTRQFINTTPVLFQLEKILPYALGPTLLFFGVLGFVSLVVSQILKPKIEVVLIILSFLLLFLPNAFLFAKWTRFIAPTFPSLAIFAAFFIYKLFYWTKNHETAQRLCIILITILVTIQTLWAAAFFSIYLNKDARISASEWMVSNLGQPATILLEGGNMVDIPLGGNFRKVSLDFYSIEESQDTQTKIIDALDESDYFIIQSRRVFLNHQRVRDRFPKTAKFYDTLFSGSLGFEHIKTFTSYPQLGIGKYKIEFPDEQAEETFTVFDHPVIRVLKKAKQLNRLESEEAFKD